MKEKLKTVRVEIGFLVLTLAFLAAFFMGAGREEGDVYRGYTVYTEHEAMEPAAEEIRTVDLNTASAEELETLPGVGEKLAAAIVSWRRECGPFLEKEDLLQVEGISERIYRGLIDHITVKGERP